MGYRWKVTPQAELLVDSVRRARPTWDINDAEAPHVATISTASSTGSPWRSNWPAPTPAVLVVTHRPRSYDDRFRFLTGVAPVAVTRHRTFAASLDWSYERLDGSERTAFRRLGVFCGLFPLEAAECVVNDVERQDSANVVDLVARLVDKSLVTADVFTSADAQYRMLETIQRYAVARAHDASELDAARDRHLSWWVEWLEPRVALPSDDDLIEVDRYQSNLPRRPRVGDSRSSRRATPAWSAGPTLAFARCLRRHHGCC